MEVLRELLPRADAGLAELGVERAARDYYLGIVDTRLERRLNGARWQRACVDRLLKRGVDKSLALAGMLERYRECSAANVPLAEWTL